VTAPGDRAARIGAATEAVARRLDGFRPVLAVVLGSGLGGVAERIVGARRIPYREIPGFHPPSVEGHKGELVAGELAGCPVLAQCGRFHLYEGWSADDTALPVRVFASLGVRAVILTNAAGGIRATFGPGTLMLLRDHLNLTGCSPLTGAVLPGEQRFPDMSAPYDAELRRVAQQAAGAAGIPLEEGVYAALPGPSYETPAEIRMLRALGADAVGMSTVLETIAARARGLRVLGISTITNLAAGLGQPTLSHEEVMVVAAQASERVGCLVEAVASALAGGTGTP
jgi:purine-nucleoside phosphorylase